MKNIKKALIMFFIALTISSQTGILISLYQKESYALETENFNTDYGIKWPDAVNAPYVDMVSWITKQGYSNNGCVNLKRIYEDTGVKFFNLGFIQSTGEISNEKLNWGWGGYAVLNENNKDNLQYQGIKKSIKDIRNLGGDVAISFGGLSGTSLWETTQNETVLFNTYKEIVNGYGLTRLDLDIEGTAQNKNYNIANAKAIKKLQDETGVEVILTLPTAPSGLTPVQLDVLEAYLSNGVNIKLVNIMAMCYGSGSLLAGENYASASIRAIDSVKNQLKDYFKKYANIELNDYESYQKIGATVSIGFESNSHPIFTTEWAKLVIEHSISKNIGMISMWSLNRDSMVENNQGVKSQYEFTNIFKSFGSSKVNQIVNPPVVDDDTIPTFYQSYDKNKVYWGGDTVIYNGAVYTAKWWSLGDIPGEHDVWENKY